MRNRVLALASVLAVVTLACTSNGPDSGGTQSGGATGPVTITLWHGQTDAAKVTLDALVEKFNSTHTDVQVDSSSGGVTTDQMLSKVLTSVAAGTYPDIAYMYGSWAANLAKSPKIADLTEAVTDPAVAWDDFWPAARETAAVNGKVIGFPAIIDNLSVVYNKDLFDAAGLGYPSSDWTWQDFRDTAKALRDPAKNIYGVNYSISGSEDTVWRFWPFLWQAGGEALNADGNEAAFNQQPGVDALTLWQQMAVVDGSVYLDPTDEKAEPLFTSGHLAMYVTGPWEVPVLEENNMNWGDQVMPSFDGTTHETISGPDIWSVFNQNDARVAASVEFLTWFSAPEQQLEWIKGAGSLPIRQSISTDPGYQDYLDAFPGIEAMVANLANSLHTRPAVTQYPRISEALGQSITAVLLGQMSPQDALNQAAEQANALLVVPT